MTFDEYIGQRLHLLLRFATVVTCDRHLAEDIVQDVVLKAHARWGRIVRTEHPDAYLKRMVVNQFLSWRRRSRRMVPVAPEDLVRAAPAVSDHATAHGERDDLLRRVAQLPPRQRAVVALRFYDSRSDAEIAAILGCREATVRTHTARALAALRVSLAGAGRPEESTLVELSPEGGRA